MGSYGTPRTPYGYGTSMAIYGTRGWVGDGTVNGKTKDILLCVYHCTRCAPGFYIRPLLLCKHGTYIILFGSAKPECLGKSYSSKKTKRSGGFAGMLLLSLEKRLLYVCISSQKRPPNHAQMFSDTSLAIIYYLVGNGPRVFFRVKSCLCVDIQLDGLPSVREIGCGCLLWGGY